jgi:hypothetical protein
MKTAMIFTIPPIPGLQRGILDFRASFFSISAFHKSPLFPATPFPFQDRLSSVIFALSAKENLQHSI